MDRSHRHPDRRFRVEWWSDVSGSRTDDVTLRSHFVVVVVVSLLAGFLVTGPLVVPAQGGLPGSAREGPAQDGPVRELAGDRGERGSVTTQATRPSAAVGTVLVVDDDGGADYTSIQAAVDAATDGDTVLVRPGTYREQVTVETNVTVVAPEGATLDGSQFDGLSHGFRIAAEAVPVIEGFTVRNYAYGVDAERPPRMGATESDWTTGWTVRNLTFVGCSEEAVRAGNSRMDWTVENVRIEGREGYVGIATFGSLGDWTVRNTLVRNVTFDGIDGAGVRGDWTIRNVSVVDAGDGIDVNFQAGEGTITDTTVRSVRTGIVIEESSGTVAITDTVVANVTHPPDDPAFNGVAVYAANTSGDWRIRDSVLTRYSRQGINATSADPPGDATGNWWGGDGPGEAGCLGSVRCGAPLSASPEAGARLDDPGAPASGETSNPDPGTPTGTDGPGANPAGESPTPAPTTAGGPAGEPGTESGSRGTAGTARSGTTPAVDTGSATGGDTMSPGEKPGETGDEREPPVDPVLAAVGVLAVLLVGGLFVRARE